MKFSGFEFKMAWNWIDLLPSVIVMKQKWQFSNNFAIEFHWLGFHLRWRWSMDINSCAN